MACGICRKPGHNRRTCTEAGTSKKLYSVSALRTAEERDFDSGLSTTNSGEGDEPKTTESLSRDLSDFLESFVRLKTKGKLDIETIHWILKAMELFNQGPSDKDPGLSSILQDLVTKSVKIDQCKNVKCRVSAQQRVNATQYQILRQIPRVYLNEIIQWNDKALERFNQGPSEKDRPGHIYILQDCDAKGSVKIGQSINVKRRVSAQQRANKTQYLILHQIPTPWAYLTEAMIHLQLNSYRDPKPEGDGRTEWFWVKPEQAILTVDQAVKKVSQVNKILKK